MHNIEKNIPIPSKKGGRGSKYPFHEMEVGDSFLYPCERANTTQYMRRLLSAANSYTRGKTNRGTAFTARVVDGGIRIWRTA